MQKEKKLIKLRGVINKDTSIKLPCVNIFLNKSRVCKTKYEK